MDDDIKKQVQARVNETEKAYPKKNNGGKSSSEIDLEFIIKCESKNTAGDAELFKKKYRKKFKFNAAADTWMYWDGDYWEIDIKGYALAAAIAIADDYEEVVKSLSKKLRGLEDNDPSEKLLIRQRKKIKARAYAARDVSRANRCLILSRSGPDALVIKGDEIDQRPYLFPCANGVLDLKSGELVQSRQEDHLLKHSQLEWQGINAPCEIWEKTLLEIFSDNKVLVDFFQRICGYALIGKVLLSLLVVLVGQGRNGKSLIVEAISKAMGQLSGAIRSEMLLDQYRAGNSAGPTPDIMALRGLRMAFASETDDGCRISPARVKWLTGNDTITGRNPHDKYEMRFSPSHTLFLLTNHKPHAPADDFAFWERVVLIPFELSFVDREPVKENERKADPHLGAKLEKELSGILAWMVRGCLEWQRYGLQSPTLVKEAVQNYKREEDIVADFIDACCVVKSGCSVMAMDVYEAFKQWWKDNIGNKPPSHPKFGRWFGKRFEKRKTPFVKYSGVGLLENDS